MVLTNGNKPYNGSHSCKRCGKACHAIETCSVSTGEEGYGAYVFCSECWLSEDNEIENQCENGESVLKASENDSEKDESVLDTSVFVENSSVEDEEENEGPSQKRKKRAYSVEDKIAILEFARRSSIRKASDHYKVDRNSIREWKTKEKSLPNHCMIVILI